MNHVADPAMFKAGIPLSAIRAGALAFSFVIHAALLVSYGGNMTAASTETITSVTRLSFLPPAPEPEVVPEKPREEIKEKPEPVESAQKSIEPEPVEEEPEPIPEQVNQVSAATTDDIPQISKGIIRWERERYLSDIVAHIERNKWYPKIARRLGVEGEIEVHFVLQSDGSVKDVFIKDGPEMLMTAARKTVERSTPLPTPPAKVDCPIECQFRMRFNLDGK